MTIKHLLASGRCFNHCKNEDQDCTYSNSVEFRDFRNVLKYLVNHANCFETFSKNCIFYHASVEFNKKYLQKS